MFLLAAMPVLHGEDTRLAAIREALVPMRSAPGPLPARGAEPVFTTIKHELRDWIESRLPALHWDGERWNPNPVVLQEQFNTELDGAGLLFHPPAKPTSNGYDYYGFLGRIGFEMNSGGVLVVKTSIGIQVCGLDESAYAYQQVDGKWKRFWETEQDDYTEKNYLPQNLRDIAIGPAGYRGDRLKHLIVTVGFNPWCTSNWQMVYDRVWQSQGTYAAARLLLDGRELAFRDEPLHAAAGRDNVLIEYGVSDTGAGFRRPEVRHYQLRSGKLERTDPVASTPRNFASFWLTDPWQVVSNWTDESSRTTLHGWLDQHRGPFNEFNSPTMHCRTRPDLWQVPLTAREDDEQRFYLLIRWRPPYRFTMVAINQHPSPDCTEEDREADQPRSLSLPP